MKLSLNWIKRYVDLPQDLSMNQLAYDLTMRTVEVEDIEHLANRYKNIVVGEILEISPHPKADRLRVTKVNIGKKEVQIVCGGINLYEGQLVVVTLPGAYAVWHGQGEPVKIEETVLRGVSSYGMICGADELGLGDLFPVKEAHEIIDLKGWNAYPGQPIAELLELEDDILEIDNKSLTNRPDLWGHYGMARELSAIYQCPLKELPNESFSCNKELDIQINSDECRRYYGIKIDGIYPKLSDHKMALDLFKVGVRPINAIVDITNYVMMTVGQPTHAFDSDHIESGIIVRRAEDGEKLILLDGKTLTLDHRDLVIADHEKILGLAGIMGGSQDSVLNTTRSIIFEIATFRPVGIRKTAKKYGLRTESSVRFEKGIDTARVDQALGFAIHEIRKLYPEAQIYGAKDVQPVKEKELKICVSLSWLQKRLGKELTTEEIKNYTKFLGFEIEENGDELIFTVPTWRATGDVSICDDILEEIARMIGYENFELQLPEVTLNPAIHQQKFDVDRKVREYFAFQRGYREIFTYPWIKEKFIVASRLCTNGALHLAEAPSPEEEILRFSLVPGLLEVASKNVRYYDEFQVFELAQVYEAGEVCVSDEEEKLPKQNQNIAGIRVGLDPVKLFYELKADLENLSRKIQIHPFRFEQIQKPVWADRHAWINILHEDQYIGNIAVVSPAVKKDADIKHHDIALFEFNMDRIKPYPSRTNEYQHIPLYPTVKQDLSVLVPLQTMWKEIRDSISNNVKCVDFIDEYHGQQVPQGYKSITMRVELNSSDKTLTNDQIDEQMNEIYAQLEKAGATLRSK